MIFFQATVGYISNIQLKEKAHFLSDQIFSFRTFKPTFWKELLDIFGKYAYAHLGKMSFLFKLTWTKRTASLT